AMLQGRGFASGADYVYALLTGYDEAPEGMVMRENTYYNNMYSGFQIAMPNPFSDDLIEYNDGTRATVEQMAYDVTTFLAWASEPKLEERRQTGIKVMLFLLFLLGLVIAGKKRLWAKIH
ncbi:MAG: cytochrome c1, partial [Pseudomonadota bacterium]